MDYKTKKPPCFDLADTLLCGQCFRADLLDDGTATLFYKDKFLKVKQEGDDLIFYDTSKIEFENIWRDYFDLTRDYNAIIEGFSTDPLLYKIAREQQGIRILRQDPFEALISFIISQNNNIPRIKLIISLLCENFGEKVKGGYAFPTLERLSRASEKDLAVIRAGFRAKYVKSAVDMLTGKKIDLEKIKNSDIAEAEAQLLKIKGVGKKVAACCLLYGMNFLDAYPKDVWINRAFNTLFLEGMPKVAYPYSGIAQQYIFNHMRTAKTPHNKKLPV